MRKGEERQLLADLSDLTSLTHWEEDFIADLVDQLELGNSLSDKQLSKLVEIHERRVLGY